MNRLKYFTKRLLLMVPTFLGITFACFTLCQFVPGGPLDQLAAKLRGGTTGEAGGGASPTGSISPADLEAYKEIHEFDKPLPVRYWNWLVRDRMGMLAVSFEWRNKTAWELIAGRLPVSLILGLTGFLLTYLICIPLGIAKAVRDNTPFDIATSVVVFVGYAIPPFALGMCLKLLLTGAIEGWPEIFPYAHFVSEDFETLSAWGKMVDVAHHMCLPVVCYVIGSFAILTLLMKNSLLEEISKDYVRTSRAKGCTRRRAVWVHALRNSLIPIATGFGGVLLLILAGAVIIETIFGIPGMGNPVLEAIVGRDYSVFMAILSLQAILGLLGNILSDFCYVLVNPRIDFAK